jgi:hypothetical protein
MVFAGQLNHLLIEILRLLALRMLGSTGNNNSVINLDP